MKEWSSNLFKRAGVLHFFTVRTGGVSPPPYDSLNLGFSSGDDPANVTANRSRVEEKFNVKLQSLAIQVHGADVLVLKSKSSVPVREPLPRADAIVSNAAGLSIPIFFADCLPIFVWDPVTKAGGLAHAGWRGTLLDMGPRAVGVMANEFGSKPENLLVAIGPSIGPCCFEVSEDVSEPFQAKYGKEIVSERGKQRFVDLWEANRKSLLLKGVNGVNIELARECTSCLERKYFSYRRDKGKTGRMAGVVRI